MNAAAYPREVLATCAPPLVVDLDGTLLRTDLLFEMGVAFVRRRPRRWVHVVPWMLKGKAILKANLVRETDIDVSALPYDSAVIDLIETGRAQGRRIVLATASHRMLAERIAAHLNLFDQILATEGTINLSGERKRRALVEEYGVGGFDYIGNSHDDVPVWAAARQACLVNPQIGAERRARIQGNISQVVRSNSACAGDWMRACRLHQWLKNLLIFVPLMAAHELTDPAQLLQGALAFLCFGMCASSVYILNDLLDLADDRHHRTKRLRPFAAGRLSIKNGLLVFPLLLAAAFSVAWIFLPWQFTGVMAAYYLLTQAYSLSLKRRMAVDVIVLAALYTMRIIAGGAAFTLPLSFWTLAFSTFMFLSLALVKRYTELHEAHRKGLLEKTRGRAYFPSDLYMIASLGAASGYMAVIVLALYIHEPETALLYERPQLIWLSCPLLLQWITRTWLITYRGQMHDDPVIFAVRDRVSLVIGALFSLVFWLAA
ncbi:hypothetical protein ACG33_07495 [Steroidobacter denitrificans]|uniref:4-hydroxybenzoate polyprenyltransferase n=1 Tax=Steroidobacter denitrificans TaxID=465721 RepID=A0A127F942_STEDE|nr:UbiA family prenyltransferase [Steroidobacter denitrificans]AMN46942.1 hypothetical protein ACG33_07495 [Steroidobacter denitrificans]